MGRRCQCGTQTGLNGAWLTFPPTKFVLPIMPPNTYRSGVGFCSGGRIGWRESYLERYQPLNLRTPSEIGSITQNLMTALKELAIQSEEDDARPTSVRLGGRWCFSEAF